MVRAFAFTGAGLVLLAAIAGCGGDGGGGQLTVPAYLESLEIVLTESSQDSAFLNEEQNREAWFNDVAITKDLVSRSADVTAETLEKLNRLNPPEALAVPHSNLVSAFEVFDESNSTVIADLEDVTTVEQLDAVAAKFPLPGVQDAAMRFADSCAGLQTYGEEQGIVVDLHCDEV